MVSYSLEGFARIVYLILRTRYLATHDYFQTVVQTNHYKHSPTKQDPCTLGASSSHLSLSSEQTLGSKISSQPLGPDNLLSHLLFRGVWQSLVQREPDGEDLKVSSGLGIFEKRALTSTS